MSESVSFPRAKNRFNLFKEAKRLGSFDEFPMLNPEVDPQVHLSSNAVDQPFYLVCEKDTIVAQMSGASRVLFREGSMRHADLGPGEFLYVPGGFAHRVLTTSPGEFLRYKARNPGREGVEWYCEKCGDILDRHVWNVADTIPQAGYQAACERLNREVERRRCQQCGTVLPPVDLAPFRWSAIVSWLKDQQSDDL